MSQSKVVFCVDCNERPTPVKSCLFCGGDGYIMREATPEEEAVLEAKMRERFFADPTPGLSGADIRDYIDD